MHRSNIKNLLTQKKQEEVKKAKKAQENITKLKKRIVQAEKDAREMSKKAKRFQKAAKKDGLTGLYNRKAFDARIEEALEAYMKGGDQFSLVIFDVDKFKWINDTFGHAKGDRVLVALAELLKNCLQGEETPVRFAGDEFVVFLPDTNLKEGTTWRPLTTHPYA